MNPSFQRRRNRGFISYVTVLAMGAILLTMLLATYRTSIGAQQTQAMVGLRIDYSEKEEAVLRSIINIAPNRAIRAMQDQSNANAANRDPLKWEKIFSEALDQANVRQSVSAAVKTSFGMTDAAQGNAGDAAFSNVSQVFDAIEPEAGFVAPGIGRSLGVGFPAPLESSDSILVANDRVYPVISGLKKYGTLASGNPEVTLSVTDYPQFNKLPYPEIRFGYAKPGELFVAKRNWWAFSLDLADADDLATGMDITERDFILSIYEIPSQLAISAEAFTVLGQHEDGTAWQNATIEGGVFATRAKVEQGLNLAGISGRRGLEISNSATIDGKTMAADPFAPGVRESFEIANNNEFLPVSLASEAGRAAFIPINRGADFFDRYAHAAESATISPTTWNNYSVGAMQCAMRLDITEAPSATDPTPSELTFSYLQGGTRMTMVTPLDGSVITPLPAGFVKVCDENQDFTFPSKVDVAYGADGLFVFRRGVSGTVTFNNATFGDPNVGTFKGGYVRPSAPFDVTRLHDTKHCVEVFPQRFPAFLAAIGADNSAVNHSLAVNVDYLSSVFLQKPAIPCTELDYGVILRECADLTNFTKGFSLVTNLRLYIGDDFNTMETPPPSGSGIPTPFYPPCSLFAPEKRYGANVDPFRLKISGQMGSLAGDNGVSGDSVHLLDMKMGSEGAAGHDKVEVNLAPISHPAALPPITMLNWLVVIEERRKEFH